MPADHNILNVMPGCSSGNQYLPQSWRTIWKKNLPLSQLSFKGQMIAGIGLACLLGTVTIWRKNRTLQLYCFRVSSPGPTVLVLTEAVAAPTRLPKALAKAPSLLSSSGNLTSATKSMMTCRKASAVASPEASAFTQPLPCWQPFHISIGMVRLYVYFAAHLH